MIARCQPGFETLLAEELQVHGGTPTEHGAGWVRLADAGWSLPDGGLCFAHAVLSEAIELTGDSVNQLAGRIADHFFASARTERFDGTWPCLFQAAAGFDGLGRRVDGVEKAFLETLKKRMSRVAKLAVAEAPRGVATVRGLFVFFVDFGRVFVARTCAFGGQRRMADDPLAPSRSYLKVEEAYVLLGREPAAGETVVDLGAAPGGWSYSAAKRGAKVIAVDNGPLKGGALDHPLIEHRREDAFGFRPAPGEAVDWLFCDLVEDPHHVINNLIAPWLANRWCRRFVVILKFGRVAPVPFLREVLAPASPFVMHATGLRVRHLYHDREEFTLVGEVKA
ncbi:MAG TPA: SAM-dependent methyltransferase [Opitutaceae bacterium]